MLSSSTVLPLRSTGGRYCTRISTFRSFSAYRCQDHSSAPNLFAGTRRYSNHMFVSRTMHLICVQTHKSRDPPGACRRAIPRFVNDSGLDEVLRPRTSTSRTSGPCTKQQLHHSVCTLWLEFRTEFWTEARRAFRSPDRSTRSTRPAPGTALLMNVVDLWYGHCCPTKTVHETKSNGLQRQDARCILHPASSLRLQAAPR